MASYIQSGFVIVSSVLLAVPGMQEAKEISEEQDKVRASPALRLFC